MIKKYLSKFIRKFEYYYFYILIKFNKPKGMVIIGCGRSGTTFSSIYLSHLGINIGHERLRYNGISSWYLVSDNDSVPFGPTFNQIKDLEFTLIHQVREPLAAISSIQGTIGGISWEFISKEIPIDLIKDSKILQAMKYWYYWNLMAESKSEFRVKAECFQTEIIPVLNALSIKTTHINQRLLNKEDKINTRSHTALSWSDLENEDITLTEKIKKLALKYGY